jgi:septum formation protein
LGDVHKKNSVFVLASASPRRKELLNRFGFPFTVQPSSIEEYIIEPQSPAENATRLALRKAVDVADGYHNAIILGVDTIVVHNGKMLGKPKDAAHAQAMLQTLSGSIHQVITGVALTKTDETGKICSEETFYEATRVKFGNLKDSAIQQYVANGSPLDKAGAYGIQDIFGALFVERIEGDFYNVMGLPIHALYKRLKYFAPELLNGK